MKNIILLSILAMLSGCVSQPIPSNSSSPSVLQQNTALSRHLKTVYYVEVRQASGDKTKLIADFTDEKTINLFKRITQVNQRAETCFNRAETYLLCYRIDGTMIKLWYEPTKLSGAQGSCVNGVPTEHFNAFMTRILSQGVQTQMSTLR